MGQEPLARYPALDGTAHCFRLHDLVAVRTGQLRPDLPDHRDHLSVFQFP